MPRVEQRCETVMLKVGVKPLGYLAKGAVCNGKRQGKWRFTFPNGQPLREGSYKEGLEEGRWRMWYAKGRKRRAEGTYEHGRRTGKWTRWHVNGKRSLEGVYRGGLRHGRWRRWHVNGTLYEDRWYVDGTREGMHWRWDREGRGVLVRSCKADVCEVLCRAQRGKRCKASDHPAVEESLPTSTRAGDRAP